MGCNLSKNFRVAMATSQAASNTGQNNPVGRKDDTQDLTEASRGLSLPDKSPPATQVSTQNMWWVIEERFRSIERAMESLERDIESLKRDTEAMRQGQQDIRQRLDAQSLLIDAQGRSIDTIAQRLDVQRRDIDAMKQRSVTRARDIQELQDSAPILRSSFHHDFAGIVPCSLNAPPLTTTISSNLHGHDHMHDRNTSHRIRISGLDCRIKSTLIHPAKRSKTEWKCPKCKCAGYRTGQWWSDVGDASR